MGEIFPAWKMSSRDFQYTYFRMYAHAFVMVRRLPTSVIANAKEARETNTLLTVARNAPNILGTVIVREMDRPIQYYV